MMAMAAPAAGGHALPGAALAGARPVARRKPEAAARRAAPETLVARLSLPQHLGTMLLVALFLCVGMFGAVRGGQYAAFIDRNGPIYDTLARAFGFGITVVEVSGASRLSNAEVAAAAGIDGRGSLLFADAEELRQRLKAHPMIAEASVRKLYPHALSISITERQPFALWQKDGEVSLVAADGTPIDQLRDARYVDLPLVVGQGANEKVKAFAALLDTQPSLKPLVKAGNWVSQRHWQLELRDGMIVELPEVDPAAALASFASMMREYKLDEKAIILVDLRLPDRVVFRLTEEAAEQRADDLKKRLPVLKGEPG
jgi:cell division protein FtsQ